MSRLPIGTVMAWDRAHGMDIHPPAYAVVVDHDRSIVVVAGGTLDKGVNLPGYIYANPQTWEVAHNRLAAEDEIPDEVWAWIAQRALTHS